MLYGIQSNLFKYTERSFANHKLKWRAEGGSPSEVYVLAVAYSLFPFYCAVILFNSLELNPF